MVSGPTVPGVDVSLTIQQSSIAGYDYDFVVTNSSLMGIVTGVYFEMDWNSMLGTGTSSGPATLVAGAKTPLIDGWEGTKASHTVENKRVRRLVGKFYRDFYYDNLDHGVQEGNVQIFSFNANSDFLTLADLENMLGTAGYGVAIKMQGLTADEQASGWGLAEEREEELLLVQSFASVPQDGPTDQSNGPAQVTAAPSPTAALAGLVVAGIAGLRRRRK